MKIKKADEHLLVRILEWHKDKDTQWAIGAAKGELGYIKVKEYLTLISLDPPQDSLMFGVWSDNDLLAYFIYSGINPQHKKARLHFVVNPDIQGKGIGREVVSRALDYGFDEGLYRIEVSPLKRNTMALNLLRNMGFTLEAFTKSSFWIGNSPVDQAQFRMLRNEWGDY